MTDEELSGLVRRISSEEDLYKLALHLGMTNEMKEYLVKDKDITTAARRLFMSWFNTQPDRKTARVKLYAAIKNTDIPGLLTEIL